MIVDMNGQEMAETQEVPTLDQKLKELVNAVAMINWTAKLVQDEFASVVEEYKDSHTKDEIIEMMKVLEQEFIDQQNAKNQESTVFLEEDSEQLVND